jgi:hypothetical protein
VQKAEGIQAAGSISLSGPLARTALEAPLGAPLLTPLVVVFFLFPEEWKCRGGTHGTKISGHKDGAELLKWSTPRVRGGWQGSNAVTQES